MGLPLLMVIQLPPICWWFLLELVHLLELWLPSLLPEELYTPPHPELLELSELAWLDTEHSLMLTVTTWLPLDPMLLLLLRTPPPPLAWELYTVHMELDTMVMWLYLPTLAASHAECKYIMNELKKKKKK